MGNGRVRPVRQRHKIKTLMWTQKKEMLCLAKEGDWESAGGSKTVELDGDTRVEQAGWGSRNSIWLKYWCRRSPDHTSWSLSMGKCQGCPTVREKLWMNFPTYPGKMKAVQSWIHQTGSLLCLETGIICSSAYTAIEVEEVSQDLPSPLIPKLHQFLPLLPA